MLGSYFKNITHNELIDILCAACVDAGKIIMDIYNSDFEVYSKDDKSPVTEADRKAEKYLINEIRKLDENIPILAEEDTSTGIYPKLGDIFIAIDPLDGTRDFINKRKDFTVNIGFINNKKPVMGIIYAPYHDELYWGANDMGSYKRSGDNKDNKITCKLRDEDDITAIASLSHSNKVTENYIKKINAKNIISAGSSLKICRISEGLADIYPRFGPTSEWDTAAGHAILLNAGGNLCGMSGEEFLYNKKEDKYLNKGFLAWGRGDRPQLP